MKSEKQPAKISYFFGPGWKDLKDFIVKFWQRNCQTARDYHDKYSEKGLMTFSGIKWLICAVSVVVYGTVFFLCFSTVLSIVLSLFFLLIYIGFSLVWLLDRAYLHHKKIFTACPEDKAKILIPTYACPSCGKKHTNLTPGKYGILHRRCECGQKMGTCFLTGRKHYDAYCPRCGAALADRENRPICIPIVGGRSVGKTAFITAFSSEFIETLAPYNGWETEFYNDKKADIYKEIQQDYRFGSTRMTDRPQGLSTPSSVSFSFFLRGKEFSPERLIHIYDIAGEVFTDNNENEIQQQYEYSHGIVLMIDPFSIPSVKNRYGEGLQPEDIAGIGKADITGIVDVFFNKLREVTGLSSEKMSSTPIAIVISKTDAPELKKILGSEAINDLMASLNAEGIKASDMDAEDLLCRRFLADNGMRSLLSSIDLKFKKNRYFACSSIGHTRDKGEYKPQGVMEPMEWLFRNADSSMDKKWAVHKFGKVPVKEV